MSVYPLREEGAEPITHCQLLPKTHYVNCLELDEDVSRDLRSLKKTVARFFNREGGTLRTVFIETALTGESAARDSERHLLIDAVAVP